MCVVHLCCVLICGDWRMCVYGILVVHAHVCLWYLCLVCVHVWYMYVYMCMYVFGVCMRVCVYGRVR